MTIESLEEWKRRRTNPYSLRKELSEEEIKKLQDQSSLFKAVHIEPTPEAFSLLYYENLDLKQKIKELQNDNY